MDITITIATVVIAISAIISCRIAYCIHSSTQKRDKEMDDMIENLVAATIVSGLPIRSETVAADRFEMQLKALRNRKNKSN